LHFKSSIVNFSSFLLCLVPLALLSGPFFPDLFISIISILFLFLAIRDGEWIYFKNKFFICFIIFYLYITFRSIFSSDIITSFESSLFYFRFGLFSLAVWYLINNNKYLIKIFTAVFLLTFTIALVDGYIQFFFSEGIFSISAPGSRLTLLMNDKLILGGYLSRLFPLIIGLLIYNFSSNKINLFVCGVLLILTDVLVYLTGERTAIALLVISTIFIILLISRFKLFRILTLFISILLIITISIYNPIIKNRNIGATIYQINPPNENIQIFSKTHDNLYKTSINIFFDNPIFGVGPKLFRNYCSNEEYMHSIKAYSCSSHPHNSYIQLLAETGLLGFLFVFSVFLYVLYISIMQFLVSYTSFAKVNIYKKYSDFQICLIACFLLTLFPLLPTQNFFNNWINIIYFLPVGFFLQSVYKDNIH